MKTNVSIPSREAGSGTNRRRAIATLFAIALLGPFMAACGSASDSSSGSGPLAGKRVTLILPTVANPWQKPYHAEIIGGLEDKGVKVTVLQDPFDAAQQAQNFQTAIAQKPDVIAFLADDPKSLAPAIAKAHQAGIDLIGLNGRAAPASLPLLATELLADSEKLGTFAAQNIVEGLQKAGYETGNVIAITGTAATYGVQDRMAGFNAYMAKYPQYKVVATEDGSWDQTKSQKIASQLFAKFSGKGGVQAAYGMADQQAAGIIQAAQQAQIPLGVAKKNGLVVTGSNCFKSGVDNIDAGNQYGTATQTPIEEGQFVMENIVKFLEGEKLPKQIFAEEFRVTAETLDTYREACSAA